jgi:hypothetical protein
MVTKSNTSALFTLHDSLVKRALKKNSDVIDKLDHISTQKSNFLYRLLHDLDAIDYSLLSPYTCYCVYQAAVVQMRLWIERREQVYQQRVSWLKTVLEILDRRWRAAG